MTGSVIEVVGIGADGWAGLSIRSQELITAAGTLLGSPRQLDLVPERPDQQRLPLPTPMRTGLPELLASVSERTVVVLASGDPLVYGIAATLIDLVGAHRVRVHPTVSSVSLAAAEMGWPSDSFDVVRVASSLAPLRRVLTPGRRVLVLSADEGTPARVAQLLVGAGRGRSALTVLADLGTPAQSRHDATAEQVIAVPPATARLNIVALTVAGPGGWPTVGGLPDEAFEHDGQLTRRDVRASALARLAPVPGQLLWDVGAGAGTAGLLDTCWRAIGPGGRLVVHAVTLETEAVLADRHARQGGELVRLSVERVEPLGSFRGWVAARPVVQWSVTR